MNNIINVMNIVVKDNEINIKSIKYKYKNIKI